jgi:phage shock protein PspC (stress-responsive transcriptional regulator)
VRLGFIALTLVGGFGIPLYIAAWLFVPEEGANQSIVAELFHHHQPA